MALPGVTASVEYEFGGFTGLRFFVMKILGFAIAKAFIFLFQTI